MNLNKINYNSSITLRLKSPYRTRSIKIGNIINLRRRAPSLHTVIATCTLVCARA